LAETRQPYAEVEEVWASDETKEEFLNPGQALCFRCSLTHFEYQVRERYFDGTNSLTGIATHTETLGSRSSFDTMMEGGYDEANSATIDIAEGVSSHLLIGWTDIGT